MSVLHDRCLRTSSDQARKPVGRAAWGWYHWAVGWAVLGLASINVFQGLALIDAGRWYVLGYALAVAGVHGGASTLSLTFAGSLLARTPRKPASQRNPAY